MGNISPSQTELPYPATRFERFVLKRKKWLMLTSFVATFLLTFLFSDHSGIRGGIKAARQSSQMQVAHAIGLAMYSYASEHDGRYPEGKSSTEIFQQMIDQRYIADASIFYFPLEGKIKPTGKKLKPENVSWDVTEGATLQDPDDLPVLFTTGYKVDYVAGGIAHPLSNADPSGMAAYYKSNVAKFIFARAKGDQLKIIAPTFDPKGKTYRQLTPDGPLP